MTRDTLGKRRRWRLFASLVFLTMLAVLLLVGLFLTHRDWRSALFMAGVAVVGPALQAFGVNWRLRKKRHKSIAASCILLGGFLILCVLNDLEVVHYDFREELDRIQSIEIIELTKPVYTEDEMEYSALCSSCILHSDNRCIPWRTLCAATGRFPFLP